MGYQALLFCPDEKLARVVSQVFSELDFSVEPVHEPFAAVKKLMAQRYDAIVVDCENEQNSSLLFKSARNSSFNQSSLAIALVEGQAGVAKAYRIGANLVLTKPINVEQAKGTLRVARGLLRKNSDAAATPGTAPTAVSVKTAPAPASMQPPVRTTAPAAPAPRRSELPEFEAPLPAAIPAGVPSFVASAKAEDNPAPIPVPAAQTPAAAAPASTAETQPTTVAVTQSEPAKIAAAPIAVLGTAAPVTSATGSAAATAPAKEVVAAPVKESRTIEFEPVKAVPAESGQEVASGRTALAASFESAAGHSPSFGSLGEEDSAESGSKKKLIVIGAAVLALVVLGYFGYGKFSKSTTAPASQPVSVPQNSTQPAPALAPMSTPSPVPTTSAPDRASSGSTAQTGKAVAAATSNQPQGATGNPPVIRIDASPQPETKKPSATPIVVKSGHGGSKAQPQADDAAPALPSGVASSANDSNLSGLMSSATPNLPKPALTSIRVSQGVSQGLVIKRVQPKYPQAALASHTGGAVQIEATVNKDGNVTNLKVLSGDPILAKAAVDAVRQWRYKPYYLDGEPVEIQTQITVNFKAN
jgi:TonB family protein